MNGGVVHLAGESASAAHLILSVPSARGSEGRGHESGIGRGLRAGGIRGVRASPDRARCAYLINAVMACNSCHTPIRPNGGYLQAAVGWAHVRRAAVQGHRVEHHPNHKDTGIGNWCDAELKAFLRTGVRPNGVPVAPIMPNIFYTVLTARDLDALVAYLRSIRGASRDAGARIPGQVTA